MISRRQFLAGTTLAAVGFAARDADAQAPGVVMPAAARPALPYGVMSGDIVGDRAIVWSRSDRSARLIVEWSTSDRFTDVRRIVGPAALDDTDFTARVDLTGFLPASASPTG